MYANPMDTLLQQQTQYRCPGLRIPLPMLRNESLDHHLLDFKHPLWRGTLSPSDGQEGSVYVSAASTGMGKTQIAYDLGRESMCTIFVRATDSAPTQAFSRLRTLLESEPTVSAAHGNRLATWLVSAYVLVALRVYLYVAVTLSNAERPDAVHVARRVMLAAFRNGVSDRAVDALFQALVRVDSDVFNWMYRLVDLRRHKLLREQKLLVCLDEAQWLMQFGQRVFSSENGMPRSALRAVADSFISLSNALTSLSLLVCGTQFSLTSCDEVRSRNRGGMIMLPLTTLLNVGRMREELQHIWTIPDELFDDAEVHAKLERLSGRPYLFGLGVLLPIFTLTVEGGISGQFTRAHLLTALDRGYDRVTSYLSSMLSSFLADARPDTERRRRLFAYVLMSHGEAWTTIDKSFVGTFMQSGIIPEAALTSDRSQWATRVVEPLSWSILFDKLANLNVREAMRMMLPEVAPTGIEGHVFALIVALRLLWNAEQSRKRARDANARVTLSELFAGYATAGLGVCGSWTVSVRFGRSLTNDPYATYLHALVSETGMNSIWYELPNTAAGPDLVFSALDSAGQPRVVAVQCKHVKSEALERAIKTLHPARQYNAFGAQKLQFNDIVERTPWLGQRWVRVVATNRPAHPKLLEWFDTRGAEQPSPLVFLSLSSGADVPSGLVTDGAELTLTKQIKDELVAQDVDVCRY